MIRYSLENVKSVSNLSARMMNFIEVNRQRTKNNKLFYNVFTEKNPFYFALVYPRTKEGNWLYIRRICLEPFVNFHLDCYANHQESYLFASSFKEIYKPVQDADGSINRYQRYLTYVMNFPTFKQKLIDTDYDLKKVPQAFFEIKDSAMGHDPAFFSKQKKENKLSNMEILIKDDIVEDLAFSTN